MRLEWRPPEEGGGLPVIWYTVLWRASNGRDDCDEGAAWSSGRLPRMSLRASGRIAYEIAGLLSGQFYELRVYASNSHADSYHRRARGWAACRGAAPLTVVDCEAPGAPVFLAAESGVGSLYVTWRGTLEDGGSDIARFDVGWRKVGAKGGFTSVTVPYSAYRTTTLLSSTDSEYTLKR